MSPPTSRAKLEDLPADATHLILSVGGNDAWGHADFLGQSTASVAEVLLRLDALIAPFARAHHGALELLKQTGLPLAVCTIYNGNFQDPQTARLVSVALAFFNDAMVRNATDFGIPLVDLREICAIPSDYANEIEPSSQGAGRIARVIARMAGGHSWDEKRTTVYV